MRRVSPVCRRKVSGAGVHPALLLAAVYIIHALGLLHRFIRSYERGAKVLFELHTDDDVHHGILESSHVTPMQSIMAAAGIVWEIRAFWLAMWRYLCMGVTGFLRVMAISLYLGIYDIEIVCTMGALTLFSMLCR